MRVRVLSEWPDSPPCGTVADLPEAVARDRVQTGFAERVGDGPETTMRAPGENAMQPKGKPRR